MPEPSGAAPVLVGLLSGCWVTSGHSVGHLEKVSSGDSERD